MMKCPICSVLALGCFTFITAEAPAHFNMLLPHSPSAKRFEPVTFTYQWGHPFEHQLFDAPAPERVTVRLPDGKVADVRLEQTTGPAGDQNQVKVYQFDYTPVLRGDYTFILKTAPIWMEEDQEFLHDIVKVVLHVQAQKGWDSSAGQDFELMPLTRPYGLRPGMVVQAQALVEGKPLAAALVEIEHYNSVAPVPLPADEHITRTVKTDPNGIVTCTLPESGWWCITAQRIKGQREHEGKAYPVRQRATLWIFVDEKPSTKPKPSS